MKIRTYKNLISFVLIFTIFVIIGISIEGSAKTITVSQDDTGDYVKIQDAIDNATVGDTVFVKNGTYYEDLIIDKSLNLTGESKDGTIINGTKKDYTVIINNNWTNISGFEITHNDENRNDGGINPSSKNNVGGILLYNSFNNSIINNTISQNYLGIKLENSSNNIISNNILSENWGTETYTGSGIFLEFSDNNIIFRNDCSKNGEGISLFNSTNNTMSNNICNLNYHLGIYIKSSNKNKILNNQCNSNNESLRGTGLSIYNSFNNEIYYNDCSNNEKEGIMISSSDNNTISKNKCFQNDNGISIYSSKYNIINNCYIFWNNDGISADISSINNTIVNCEIKNNSNFGIYFVKGSSNNLVYKNNIIDNPYQAFDEGINSWDNGSIGNYWTDYSGIDENSDGIGDSPYNISGGNNVDRFPIFILILPDLVIRQESIIFSNQNPKDGEEITIFFNVSNIGQIDASNIYIAIYDGKKLLDSFPINNIRKGYQTSMYINFTAKKGTKNITIIIDPDNNIPELNETNNIAYKEITFQKGEEFPFLIYLLIVVVVILISLIFTINNWYPTGEKEKKSK